MVSAKTLAESDFFLKRKKGQFYLHSILSYSEYRIFSVHIYFKSALLDFIEGILKERKLNQEELSASEYENKSNYLLRFAN